MPFLNVWAKLLNDGGGIPLDGDYGINQLFEAAKSQFDYMSSTEGQKIKYWKEGGGGKVQAQKLYEKLTSEKSGLSQDQREILFGYYPLIHSN